MMSKSVKPRPSLQPESQPEVQPVESAQELSSLKQFADQVVEKIATSMGLDDSDEVPSNITVDLGFAELIDINGGYVSSRPELDLTPKARAAVKRLSLTLEQREATLSDGSQVRQSVPKAIVWLLERFADSIA